MSKRQRSGPYTYRAGGFIGPLNRPPGSMTSQITVVPRTYGNARAISERKYFETEKSASGVAQVTTAWTDTEQDPGALGTFFAPVTGNDIINRIGRKCQVIAWKVKGFINVAKVADQTAAFTAALARLIFYIDNQTNGAQAQGEDVITSNMVQGTPAEPGICMFQNKNNFGRFKVLKDKMISIQDPNLGTAGANYDSNGKIYPFKCSFRFKKPLTIHFNQSNGGTVADVVNTSFHCIAAQNTVDLQATLSYKSRITFIDL